MASAFVKTKCAFDLCGTWPPALRQSILCNCGLVKYPGVLVPFSEPTLLLAPRFPPFASIKEK